MREENIVTISDYLRSRFAGCTVEDEEVSNDHIFRVVGGEEAACRLHVDEAFLDDTPPLETVEELEKFDIAGVLRSAGEKPVLLTPSGPEVLGE